MREFLRGRGTSNAYVLGFLLVWLTSGHHWWLANLGGLVGFVLLAYGGWLDFGLAAWWERRKARGE